MRKHNHNGRLRSHLSLDVDEILGRDELTGSSKEDELFSMYVEEATEQDKTLLKGWNDALDVLLILAGLFSAVLTAFLIESYKLLQPDPQDSTAALLLLISQRLDVLSLPLHNGTAITRTSASPVPPPFAPSPSGWWINVLWFSSLMCSLSSAFIAMLAKQWLHAYTMERPGRVEACALQRHFRYSGLIAWKIPEIITTLPVLLQTGFALFFVGLDVLLWSINTSIGYLMIFFTILLLGFYIITTIAPLIYLACPFKTPFSLNLRTRTRWLYYRGCSLLEHWQILLVAFWTRTTPPPVDLNRSPISNVELEYTRMDRSHHVLIVGIIQWLVETSHSEEVVDMALRAISALRPDFNATSRLRDSGAMNLLLKRLEPPLIKNPSNASVALRRHATRNFPYLTSMFCALRYCTLSDIAPILSRFHWRAWIVSWEDFSLEQLISQGWDINTLAIYLCANAQCDRAEGRRPNREFHVMLEILNRHSTGKAKLNSFVVWALVDTIAVWGVQFVEQSMISTRPAVVASLLGLLTLPYTMGDPVTRAIGLALGVFVLGFDKETVDQYQDEEKRREDSRVLLIRGIVEIMKTGPNDPSSRYNLSNEDFERGGMVICNLLIENDVPTSWPSGVSTVLLVVLAFPSSEALTCQVLETFRRLFSFDSQPSILTLSSIIAPLLEAPTALSVRIGATQLIGEMMHWKEHHKTMLRYGIISPLIRNLNSPSADLANASSLAIIGLARDSEARDLMVGLGLADALIDFFHSNNVTQQNLAYWSWSFVWSSWSETRLGVQWSPDIILDFRRAVRELLAVLQASMDADEASEQEQWLTKDVPSSPVRRRDLERILSNLRRLAERWEDV